MLFFSLEVCHEVDLGIVGHLPTMGVATACLVALVAGAGLEVCCGGFCVVAVVVCWCSCVVMMFLVHVFISINA